MIRQPLPEPTAEQCSDNSRIAETDTQVAHAIWYPQMGGYVGKAIAVMSKHPDSCIDVYIWHNGEFPFEGVDESPRLIHHCDPEQFINFGRNLQDILAVYQ